MFKCIGILDILSIRISISILLFVASLQLQPRKETTSDPPENDDKQAEPKGRNVEMLVAARRCVNSVMAMVKTEGASSTEAASVKTEGASSRAATASGGREIIFTLQAAASRISRSTAWKAADW